MRTHFTVLAIFLLLARSAAGFSVTFDYTYDTNNFFGVGSTARTTLEAAGTFYESLILDDFDAIVPTAAWRDEPPGPAPSSGEMMWQAGFFHPSTGAYVTEDFLSIAADSVIIYVGARNLGGSTLGQAGPGGFGVKGAGPGAGAWVDTVVKRGEIGEVTGATATEFAPWGGNLAVDLDSTWNLDHTVLPGGSENDLYSVVLHEMAHIFGIGIADPDPFIGVDSWENLAIGNTFTGSVSTANYGGSIPLLADDTHFVEGTMSTVYGGATAQEASMDPTITVGTRKLTTSLDAAALDDIGWDIAVPVPEPRSLLLFLLAAPLALSRGRARGRRRRS